MKSELRTCIDLHLEYANATPLSETMGDGFLYAKSPIFRAIRDLVMNDGYEIHNKIDEESNQYFLTQLFRLDQTLFKKKLYARHTFTSIKTLADQHPDLDLKLREIATMECHSPLLHEAAHGIGRSYFGWTSLKLQEQPDQAKFLQQLMIVESLAMTFDFLVCAEMQKGPEKSLAILNAVGRTGEDEYFVTLADLIGMDDAILWLFRGYFASNCFYEAHVSPPGFISTLIKQDLPEKKADFRAVPLIESVFNNGFTLNIRARSHTASVFFKLIGLKGNFKNAMPYNIYEALSIGSPADLALRHFCKLILGDRQNIVQP